MGIYMGRSCGPWVELERKLRPKSGQRGLLSSLLIKKCARAFHRGCSWRGVHGPLCELELVAEATVALGSRVLTRVQVNA